MRYLFNRPIRASLDTVEVMLLVFVFNGMAAGFFGRRHVTIDLLDNVFGPRVTAVLIRTGDALSVLCLGLLFWAMLLPAGQAFQYGDTKMELPIPIYALWIVALLSIAGTIFCALVALLAKPATPARTRRMSPSLIGAGGVVVLFALLLLRVPVWIALVLVGFFGNVLVNGWPAAFALAGTAPFDVASSYTLSVVPLFILMGEVASGSRLSGELFNAARVILSGFRGGLAVATLAASALFGAVSGSSLANSATMTRMALPELRKAGYDDGLSTGCIAAGGSTDILIPPSIILVIYAAIAELSVPKLLAAGLIPGLVLTVLYMMVALVVVTVRPHYAPDRERYTMRQRIAALREPWQFIALFIVTIGGIYAGVFSPTEAASIGAFGAILLGAAGSPHVVPRCARCHREHRDRQRRAVRHRHRRQPVLVLHRADPSAGPAAGRLPRPGR